MLTSLKIAKWSTSAINSQAARRVASKVGRILAESFSPARPFSVAGHERDWPRKVCRLPYFRSPNPQRVVGATRGRPGGYGWPGNLAAPH